jgi:hypothetical protein
MFRLQLREDRWVSKIAKAVALQHTLRSALLSFSDHGQSNTNR